VPYLALADKVLILRIAGSAMPVNVHLDFHELVIAIVLLGLHSRVRRLDHRCSSRHRRQAAHHGRERNKLQHTTTTTTTTTTMPTMPRGG
jgi:hypothetical protein